MVKLRRLKVKVSYEGDDVVENSPSSTGTIVNQWVNPTRAYTSDNLYAEGQSDGYEQDYSDYGFNIPSGSAINQVLVKVEHKEDAYWRLLVKVSWDGGATWGPVHTLPERSTETLDTVDVTGDTSWTPEKLSDANFKVVVTSDYVGGSGGGCFALGSEIGMADGSLKRVEDVKVGDEILGWEKGDFKRARVRRRTRHRRRRGEEQPYKFYRIYCRIPDHRGGELKDVAITGDHPIFEGRRRNIPASEVKVGDWLTGLFITEQGFELDACRVEKIETFEDYECVNIEPEAEHLFAHFQLLRIVKI
jgi:hypothetical protein